jgi:hypothetical protein
VWDAGAAAGLEERRPGRDGDAPAARIGQVRHAAPPGPPVAQHAQTEHEGQKREEADQEAVLEMADPLKPFGAGEVEPGNRRLQPGRILGQAQHVAPGHEGAEQREHGDQQRGRKGHEPDSRVPRPETQPVVQADAAVGPGEGHHGELAERRERLELAEDQQDVSVAVLGAEHLGGEARAQQVQNHERRDREAGQELRRLPGRHDETPAPVERQKGEAQVQQQRAVEQQRGRRRAPERDEPEAPDLERLERDQAEGMVQKVRQHEGEEHEAARKAQPAYHGVLPDRSCLGDDRPGPLACKRWIALPIRTPAGVRATWTMPNQPQRRHCGRGWSTRPIRPASFGCRPLNLLSTITR